MKVVEFNSRISNFGIYNLSSMYFTFNDLKIMSFGSKFIPKPKPLRDGPLAEWLRTYSEAEDPGFDSDRYTLVHITKRIFPLEEIFAKTWLA